MTNSPAPTSSFPLTGKSLIKFRIDPDFDYADIRKARGLVYAIQSAPPQVHRHPLYASELAAIGALGKIFFRILSGYEQKDTMSPFEDLDRHILSFFTENRLNTLLTSILDYYPLPQAQKHIEEQIRGPIYKSCILLFLAKENPALDPYRVIFIENDLFSDELFDLFQRRVEGFFNSKDISTPFHTEDESLLDLLRRPFQSHPTSIFEQLLYIQRHWTPFLDDDLVSLLSRNLDFIREEHNLRGQGADTSPEPLSLTAFEGYLEDDSDHFSQDRDWMSNVVLIAKNIYVWLDQLSRSYSRHISTLDQIPDEELASLSQRGITGLWLIGIWKRSPASKQIKRLCGNPEAIPSAYSIYDYSISQKLGGVEAYQLLSQKASRFGIRLAADMVPNHVGIYSKWVIDHPDYFLSLQEKPYPNYSYTGPDLSEDENIGIFIEDHYYDNTDAAVVFKRIDYRSQDVRFIYHGNDGTSMPWNDTAQLNYLRKSVRESIIDTILKVADMFPIVRFDAAMTLTKKHFQRLWFPEPGSGGAIPTRSEHGLTKDEFDALFPEEFWRLVVQRIAAEKPDTLLIAEAFWMMEGFFVRNLGMHRVYNSAFMHMLRDEKNAKFKEVIKKTLSHDPRILKRYVNFMNNPDEETAIAQFGEGGKYFAVCVMMVTLPGLPMFGHGQIEGFHEKYGMEYDKAYYDERPTQSLVARHQKEIFPLLMKRHLFSGVDHFVLYDLANEFDQINDDVFVYSNRNDQERALVIVHNKWTECQGAILESADLNGNQQTLGEALGLEDLPKTYVLFKDHITGLEYIHAAQDFFEKGIKVELGAYEYHVFLDFHQVTESKHGEEYAALNQQLSGKGVASLEKALNEIRFQRSSLHLERFLTTIQDKIPIDSLFSSFVNKGALSDDILSKSDLSFISNLIEKFHREVMGRISPPSISYENHSKHLNESSLSLIHSLAKPISIPLRPEGISFVYQTILSWTLLSPLLDLFPYQKINQTIEPLLHNLSPELFSAEMDRGSFSSSVSIALHHTSNPLLNPHSPSDTLNNWLEDPRINQFLHIHDHEGIRYYHQERFEYLLLLLGIIVRMQITSDSSLSREDRDLLYEKLVKHHQVLLNAHDRAQFQVNRLKEIMAP